MSPHQTTRTSYFDHGCPECGSDWRSWNPVSGVLKSAFGEDDDVILLEEMECSECSHRFLAAGIYDLTTCVVIKDEDQFHRHWPVDME